MAELIVRAKADFTHLHSGVGKITREFDGFAQKNMTLNGLAGQLAGGLGKLAVGFSAAKLATSAFNTMLDSSQTLGDSVRNSMTALSSVTSNFMAGIANADFSMFLGGLDQMFIKAKEAADAVDDLFNVSLSAKVSKARSQLGFDQALSVIRDGDATKAQKEDALSKMKNAVEEVKSTSQKEFNASMSTLKSLVASKSHIKATDLSDEDIYRALVARTEGNTMYSQAVFNQGNARATKTVAMNTSSVTGGGVATYEQFNQNTYDQWAKQRSNSQHVATHILNQQLSDEDLQKYADIYMQGVAAKTSAEAMERQYLRAANQVNKKTPPAAGGGSNGVKADEYIPIEIANINSDLLADPFREAGVKSLAQLQKDLDAAKKMIQNATTGDEFTKGETLVASIQAQMDAQPLALKANISIDEAVAKKAIEEQMEEMRKNMKPLPLNSTAADEGAKASKSWEKTGAIIGRVGSLMAQTGNKGINVAGTIMQAVANIALGFSKSSIAAAGGGPFAWIAATVSGLATMVATISSIKSATKGSFAEGGIVPGVYNGGMDNSYVYASPGEVILNRAQQSNLLSQMDRGSNGGVMDGIVRGENIYISLRNYMRRTGATL